MTLDLENTDLSEEISAINAIYEPDTLTITSTASNPRNSTTSTLDLGAATPTSITTAAKLQLPVHAYLSFVIGFEPSYPDTPPHVVGTASTGSRGEGRIAVDALTDIIRRTHQTGAVCLFEVINEAVEAFGELNLGGSQVAGSQEEENRPRAEPTELTPENETSTCDSASLDQPPSWTLSSVTTEKKSVFVGRVAAVASVDQAHGFLDHLLATEKKVAAATHNISAWRIRQKLDSGAETTVQDFDDDGETAAGGRLLHLMQLMDVWDVVVVVSRWYGGVKLGPDRFRLINAVGKEALIRGGFTGEAEGNGEKARKKGRR